MILRNLPALARPTVPLVETRRKSDGGDERKRYLMHDSGATATTVNCQRATVCYRSVKHGMEHPHSQLGTHPPVKECDISTFPERKRLSIGRRQVKGRLRLSILCKHHHHWARDERGGIPGQFHNALLEGMEGRLQSLRHNMAHPPL